MSNSGRMMAIQPMESIVHHQYNFQFNLTICDTSGQPLSYYSPKDLEGFIYYSGKEKVEFNSVQNPVDMGSSFSESCIPWEIYSIPASGHQL